MSYSTRASDLAAPSRLAARAGNIATEWAPTIARVLLGLTLA